MIPKDTVQYILDFLVGESHSNLVGYTADPLEFANYKVVIRPSDSFELGNEQGKFSTIGDTPILVGENQITKVGSTLVTDADFVASTFCLISRYCETISAACDSHGRVCGRKSLLGLMNYLHRPLADEYGAILRSMLREQGVTVEEPVGYSKIYLTHDADKLTQYRNFRGLCGGILRAIGQGSLKRLKSAFKTYFGKPDDDPLFTFPDLFALDRTVPNAQIVTFVKAGKSTISYDKPIYDLKSADAQRLIELCRENGSDIGLHTSYLAGGKPDEIPGEKQRLETVLGNKVTQNRYHFLRSCNPEDMQALADAGITDDFTMGFADVAGFRLGTCRAVRWINPWTEELTNITLHPLVIMDCSLSDPRYMALSADDAFKYCKELLEQIKRYVGEVVLLWHNTSVSELNGGYHRELYEKIINLLRE